LASPRGKNHNSSKDWAKDKKGRQPYQRPCHVEAISEVIIIVQLETQVFHNNNGK